jgi:2-formylbenzoate dehydrogenase
MTQMLIGGRLAPAADGRTYDDVSPVTGEVIARVPDASDADVANAVNAAAAAAKSWRKVPARERGALVGRLADVVAAHADELAELDAIDGGHPVTTMHHDVGLALDMMRLFAGLGGEIKGETIPASGEHLIEAIKVGDPRDPGTEMGTLATRAQYEKALRYIELGRSEGARVRTGGGRPPGFSDADPGCT